MTRPDAGIKVRGAAEFGTDLDEPGMLWAVLVLAEQGPATIRSIDLSGARARPGVVAVAAADADRLFPLGRDLHRPVFPRTHVRYRSEPIAAVAAPSLAEARGAARRIRVTLEPTSRGPEVERLEPTWQPTPDDLERHVNAHVRARTGDPEAAFRDASFVLGETYRTSGIRQVSLEPHACLARPENGGFHVRTSTQTPFGVRDDAADILGLAPESLRIEGTWVGGGFGGKGAALLEPYAIVLAAAADRPVRLALTYREEFLLSRSTCPAVVRIESAVRDGRITGRRIRLILDTGASLPGRDFATGYAIGFLVGPYRIPHVDLEGFALKTHRSPFGPHRAPFAPQCAFIAESHMDALAAKLGVDPIDFRLDHALEEGDQTVLGQPVGPFGLATALRKAKEFRDRWRASRPTGHGIGVGAGFWSTSAGAGGEATVALSPTELVIYEIEREVGSGSVLRGLSAVAERVTGLPASRIRVVAGDTSTSPFDSGVFGSRTVAALGGAVAAAIEILRRDLAARWGPGNSPLSFGIDGDEIVVKQDRHHRPLRELLTESERAGRGVEATGQHYGTSGSIDDARVLEGQFYPYTDFTASVHVAQVDVDQETGQVRVERYAAIQDVGTVIDTSMATAQVEGGVAMGLGTALTEETMWAADGRLLNAGLLDYRIPTLGEIPPIEAIFVDGFPGAGPFGAKGLGEPPIIPVAAAVANAVRDATGVAVHDLPLTAERVARAVIPP